MLLTNEKLIRHSEFYERDKLKPSSSFKLIALLCIILLYGSSLLLYQVNSLYVKYHDFQHINEKQQTFQQDLAKHTDALLLSTLNKKIPLSFSLVRNGTFTPESKSIQWIQTPQSLTNDSGDYIVVKDGEYILKSLKTPESSKVLYDLGSVLHYQNKNYEVEDITFSDDLKLALIVCNKIHSWRHSFFATYFIFNVYDNKIQPLFDSNQSSNENIALAKWSPDSSKISYIFENNVYIKNISNFTDPQTTQITFDGGAEIFYGKPDWVYEEEVFESDTALWWSPNSSHLLLLRSNDTEVPTFPIPYFVQPTLNNDSSYPLLREIKYPKAGFANPIVDILIFDLNSKNLRQLPKTDPFYNDENISNTDRLITEVTWVGGENVLVRVTNRESDLLKIFVVSCSDENLSSIVSRFEDGNQSKVWFEITHNTLYIPKSESRYEDGYIDIVDVDGYDHLAYFAPANATEPKWYLTQGQWEVVDGASAYDYVSDKVYYISTEKSSMERHVYSVGLDGRGKKNVTNTDTEAWYSVSFSKGAKYLLLDYQGPEVPYQKLIDLHDNKEENFIDNKELKKSLNNYDIPVTRYGEIELDDGIFVNYKETLPLNFDRNKKYPLLFFVYGGPGSQLVQKMYTASFSSIIASELNAVVVTVDGRGTGYKGKKFRNIVRDQLGKYEVVDQISAAKKWIKTGYIDNERTAIWGWSYGGFMTLKTLEHDKGSVFKYGMSVAPVTNWMYYDSVYTERYMHTPEQNLDGYMESSVHNPEGFKNVTRFLLMHGTGDDNVHFQNSLKFLDMLDLAGVENYDMHIFPDSDHSIRYHNANIIVYDKLFNWLKLAFQGEFECREKTSNLVIDDDFTMDLYG